MAVVYISVSEGLRWMWVCVCLCCLCVGVYFSSCSCSCSCVQCTCRMRLYTHRWFLFLTFIQMHWNANKWFLEYQNYTARFLLLLLLHSPDENFVIAEKETFSKIVRLCIPWIYTFQSSVYPYAFHIILWKFVCVVRKTNAELLMLRLKPSGNEQKTFQSILLVSC